METTVKERPILFSTPMVQGILSQVKRMTRRTKGLEEINKSPEDWRFTGMRDSYGRYLALFRPAHNHDKNYQIDPKKIEDVTSGTGIAISCPYGKPGDRLWVRETWAETCDEYGTPVMAYKVGQPIMILKDVEGYKLGSEITTQWSIDNYPSCGKWKPSIHISRWASRILLEIEDIRVERLQDITEEDAIAEGVEKLPGVMSDSYKHYSAHLRYSKEELKECCPFTSSARASFCSLWESLNGRESLLQNPWVWVVTFKVVEVKK